MIKMGKSDLNEWLLWMAGQLIEERISFSMNAMSDGWQWNVGVHDERDSKRLGALIMQWKREHELPA